MQKASADSINNAYVSVKGFLTNEAPNMQAMSDPSIQLPLSTARSDANRLQDELAVLKRNPGLQSSLTVDDLNGIEANLGYLQRKWRLSANSVTPVEGFECGCKAGSIRARARKLDSAHPVKDNIDRTLHECRDYVVKHNETVNSHKINCEGRSGRI